MFEAISKFYELKNKVICKFYGDANSFVYELAKRYDCSQNVEVYDPITRSEVLKIQSSSHILLLLTWDVPEEKGVFPGKFFEYVGSAKPILLIGCQDNVAAETIRKYGFGIATNNIFEIRDFIINYENYAKKIKMNYQLYRHLFERKHQINKLVKIFEEILTLSKSNTLSNSKNT